jgi:lysozyme family protein
MYISGKYVKDNVYAPDAISKQIGGMVLIKCMIDEKIIDPISEHSPAVIMN